MFTNGKKNTTHIVYNVIKKVYINVRAYSIRSSLLFSSLLSSQKYKIQKKQYR